MGHRELVRPRYDILVSLSISGGSVAARVYGNQAYYRQIIRQQTLTRTHIDTLSKKVWLNGAALDRV